MIKRALTLRLAAILCLALSSMASVAQTRIMVISDPHTVSGDKQATVESQSGKLDKHSYDIFSKAAKNIIQSKPDLLLVCGDLTYNGEVTSHDAAHAILKTVSDAGIPVKVIPGNHDILNPNSIDDGSANITAEEFASRYVDMGYESGVERDVNSLSWATSINDKLAIIGLDANIYSTGTYYSDGCLRTSTLNWMKEQAAAFHSQGKMVIAMVHQEIMNHFSKTLYGMTVTQATVAPTSILNNNYKHNPMVTEGEDATDVSLADVQKAFADAGIQYVLTGHFHVHNIATLEVTKTDGTKATLEDISTGGLSTYPCWMRTLMVNEEAGTLTSTSTLVEMNFDGETGDLQDQSKTAVAGLNAAYPMLAQLGTSVPTLIEGQMVLEPYEFYDGTEVTHTGTFPSVTYTRTFNNNSWQALFIPFATVYGDWNENFDVALVDNVSGSALHFKSLSADADAIAANTIALVKLKSGKATGEYSISSSVKTSDLVSIAPDTETTKEELADASNTYTLFGTYSGITGGEMYSSQLYGLGGGALKKVASSVAGSSEIFIKPMRWVMNITPKGSGAKPASLPVLIDEEMVPTAIDFTEALQSVADSKAYRLDGTQASDTSAHGIYIINGKKIVR